MDFMYGKIISWCSIHDIQVYWPREEGYIGLFTTLVPNVLYNNIFLFVGLTTLGTFIEFWFVGSLIWVSKRFNHLL